MAPIRTRARLPAVLCLRGPVCPSRGWAFPLPRVALWGLRVDEPRPGLQGFLKGRGDLGLVRIIAFGLVSRELDQVSVLAGSLTFRPFATRANWRLDVQTSDHALRFGESLA